MAFLDNSGDIILDAVLDRSRPKETWHEATRLGGNNARITKVRFGR